MKINGKLMVGILAAALMTGTMAAGALAETKAEDSVKEYRNGDMVLSVPEEYDELLLVGTPEDDPDGTLFTVCEKASVEAAEAKGYGEDSGLGQLFSIERTDEEHVKELRCGDMSGTEIFASDAEGCWYLYNHPTDVRIEFAEGADRDAAMQQWSMLNEWAWKEVRSRFIADNPGLTEEFFGNTSLDIYLAQIELQGRKDYTISTLEYGPLEPGDTDPVPFLKQLEGMTLTYTDEEAPDGEYAVLTFPEDDHRFDFFFMTGKENYVREVIGLDDGDESETLYKAEFPDGTTKLSSVMEELYKALAEADGK